MKQVLLAIICLAALSFSSSVADACCSLAPAHFSKTRGLASEAISRKLPPGATQDDVTGIRPADNAHISARKLPHHTR